MMRGLRTHEEMIQAAEHKILKYTTPLPERPIPGTQKLYPSLYCIGKYIIFIGYFGYPVGDCNVKWLVISLSLTLYSTRDCIRDTLKVPMQVATEIVLKITVNSVAANLQIGCYRVDRDLQYDLL
jgi:hypothetical protein